MNEKALILKNKAKTYYFLLDFLSVILVWVIIALVRSEKLHITGDRFLVSGQLIRALLVFTFWLLLFTITGAYRYSVF